MDSCFVKIKAKAKMKAKAEAEVDLPILYDHKIHLSTYE